MEGQKKTKPFIAVPNSLIQWSNIDESKSLVLPLYLYSAQNAHPSTNFHIITSPATLQSTFGLTSNQSRLVKNLRSAFSFLSSTISGASFDHSTNNQIKIQISDTPPTVSSLTPITPSKAFEYDFIPFSIKQDDQNYPWTPITYERFSQLLSELRASGLDPVKGINLYMIYTDLINHYKTNFNFSKQFMQDLTMTSYHTLQKYLDFFTTHGFLEARASPNYIQHKSTQFKIKET